MNDAKVTQKQPELYVIQEPAPVERKVLHLPPRRTAWRDLVQSAENQGPPAPRKTG